MKKILLFLVLFLNFNLHAENSKVKQIRLNEVISRLLKNDEKLKKVDFNYLELKEGKLDEFVDALKQNSYLETLCFKGLKISDDGFKEFLTVFDKNNTIKKLCLNGMLFNKNKIDIIINFLEKNSSLLFVELNDDGFDLEAVKLFNNVLKNNYTIKTLDLKNNLSSKNEKHVKIFELFCKSLINNYSLNELEIFDRRYNKKRSSSIVLEERNFDTSAYRNVNNLLDRNKKISENINNYDLFNYRKQVYDLYKVIFSENNELNKKFFWGAVAYLLKHKAKQNDLYKNFTDLMQEECPICSQKLFVIDGDNISVTKCGHIFHQECLELWLNENRICPMCRAKL